MEQDEQHEGALSWWWRMWMEEHKLLLTHHNLHMLPHRELLLLDDDTTLLHADATSTDTGSSSSSIWRFLAEKLEYATDKMNNIRIDYSVLAVCVMTLGLIMVVEVLRHRLDHAAHGRPYFTAVLENVYAELATLGIVEFFLFLLQTYYTDMNKAKKTVFGMVHFALFYTAILNAFQSVILAFFTRRVSRRLWVQTEALELGHYVEIREEFERISRQLHDLKQNRNKKKHKKNKHTSSSDDDEDNENINRTNNPHEEDDNDHEHEGEEDARNNNENHDNTSAADPETGRTATTGRTLSSLRWFSGRSIGSAAGAEDTPSSEFVVNWNAIHTSLRGTADRIRYPRLKRRYNKLLVQVRFHELRLHFVEAYKLPPKFWVSEYLMRSELSVLIKLVHVSTYAWLLLTASANLLYYLLGIVGTFSQDPEMVGVALVYIFFGSMFIFVVVAMLLYRKMELVFKSIMHKRHLWQEAAPEPKRKPRQQQQEAQSSHFRKSNGSFHESFVMQQQRDSFHGSLYGGTRNNNRRKSNSSGSKVRGELAREQLSLFWMSSPKLVITVIQFMQFGYAVALSVVIIFQEELEQSELVSHIGWYWFTVLFCYACFVAVAVKVIPSYTLCTSLGQLVDRQRLHETVAVFRLNEARRQHVEQLILQAYTQQQKQQQEQQDGDQDGNENDGGVCSQMIMSDSSAPETSTNDLGMDTDYGSATVAAGLLPPDHPTRQSNQGEMQVVSEVPGSLGQPQIASATTSIAPATMTATTESASTSVGEATHESSTAPIAIGTSSSTSGGGGATTKQLDPSMLRDTMYTVERQGLAQRDKARAERRRRRKRAVSDGVALMVGMARTNTAASAPQPTAFAMTQLSESLSSSQGTHGGNPAAQSLVQLQSTMAGDLASTTTTTGTAPMATGTSLPPRAAERAARRRNRKKSVSDGVALMARLSTEEAMGSSGGAGPLDAKSVIARTNMAPLRVKMDSGTRAPSQSIGDTSKIAELVKMDTESLRAALPQGELEKLSERERQKQRGRPRRKATSGGVEFMSGMSDESKKHNPLLAMKSSQQRRNSGSLSDVAAEMLTPEDTRVENLRARRGRRRKKTVSDGVAFMASLTPTEIWGSTKTTDDLTTRQPTVTVTASGSSTGSSTLFANPVARVASTLPTVPTVQAQDDVAAELVTTLDVVDEHHDETGVDVTENDSIASIRSVASGYCHSDVDDVPEVDRALAVVEYRDVISFRDRCRWFFLDKRYIVMSNVFGTMVAFFFVAERVERFLHTENILQSGKFVSFDFDETITFWLLSTWFYLFFIVDSLVFYSLGYYGRLATAHERDIWVSAAIDVVIVSVCLTVFYIAEVKRCCDPDKARRVLAEAVEATEYPYYGPAPCNCPDFGTRLYGGLGYIEPYTSLIALRLFRFWTATFIVRRLDVRQGKSPTKEEEEEEEAEDEPKLDPFDVYNSNDVHGHGDQEEKGTAAELWEKTVGRNQDIVAKHGEFSREVLMAMLGIPIVEDPPPDDNIESNIQSSPSHGEFGRTPISPVSSRMPSFRLDEETNDLPVDTQESVFDSPNATLVRSMRRADRKVLPILNTWCTVDVVMTRFEMVYFDAANVDNEEFLRDPLVGDARRALIATKGGKGLSLREVAVGRRVVGRLALSEATAIAVEREMPCDSIREGDEISDNVIQTEYWNSKGDVAHTNRSNVWHTIKQDSLRVQTNHGHTLYLRFYSDLDDAEHHPEKLAEEDEQEGLLHKNNAFQWAQTIGRHCGPERLKQQLPHFGENSDDELRDYLVVKSEEERKGHRGVRSRAAMLAFPMRRYPSSDEGMPSEDSGHFALASRIKQRLQRGSSSGGEVDTGPDPETPTLGSTRDIHSKSLTALTDAIKPGSTDGMVGSTESSSETNVRKSVARMSPVSEAGSPSRETGATLPLQSPQSPPRPAIETRPESLSAGATSPCSPTVENGVSASNDKSPIIRSAIETCESPLANDATSPSSPTVKKNSAPASSDKSPVTAEAEATLQRTCPSEAVSPATGTNGGNTVDTLPTSIVSPSTTAHSPSPRGNADDAEPMVNEVNRDQSATASPTLPTTTEAEEDFGQFIDP